ncbi:MAG: hypothetical protein G01um101419_525 [Parcubacteria group bacterium Gr01-1014_19]|nr:MAG: hypothetical protein G01um101419_525 [Parcubacteria group bacterium Gr01-1014_19]
MGQESASHIVDELKGMTAVESDLAHQASVEKMILDHERRGWENIEKEIKAATERGLSRAGVMLLSKGETIPNEYGYRIINLSAAVTAYIVLVATLMLRILIYHSYYAETDILSILCFIVIIYNMGSSLLCSEFILYINYLPDTFFRPTGFGQRVWSHLQTRGFKTRLVVVNNSCPAIEVSW